jgi:hypothetical protein
MENLRLLVGTSSQICAEERYKRILVDTALWLFDGDWRSNPGALETFASQAADRAVRQARTHAAGPQVLQKNSQAENHGAAADKVRYAREFFEGVRPGGGRGRRINRAQKLAERPRKPVF